MTLAQLAAPEVPLTIRGKPSAKFAQEMRAALSALPDAAKRALGSFGARVDIGRTLTGTRPDLKGVHPRGWPDGFTWDNSEGCASPPASPTGVWVAERLRDPFAKGKPWVTSRRAAHVMRHELGHVIDYAHGGASHSPGFMQAYDADRARVHKDLLLVNPYFLQEGEAGREETFAEQVASVVSGGTDMQMPHTYAYVKALLGLGN